MFLLQAMWYYSMTTEQAEHGFMHLKVKNLINNYNSDQNNVNGSEAWTHKIVI